MHSSWLILMAALALTLAACADTQQGSYGDLRIPPFDHTSPDSGPDFGVDDPGYDTSDGAEDSADRGGDTRAPPDDARDEAGADYGSDAAQTRDTTAEDYGAEDQDSGTWDSDVKADGQTAETVEDAEENSLCDGFAGLSRVSLCRETIDSCEIVFDNGQGCKELCEGQGLVCRRVFENIDGQCAADYSRPELSCSPGSGHQSDFCVCGTAVACTPQCGGKVCGPDGCGGVCGSCGGGSACNGTGTRCETVQVLCSATDCPAFPGAEGFGANAKGGRGGGVCKVTSLGNSGAGTLRECLASGSGPVTVVFNVGGIIDLTSPLTVNRSYVTIAGQTAPGDGITVRGYQTDLRGDHIIVQHIRFRAGDIRKKKSSSGSGFTEDSLTATGNNIIVDHVSASWGIDEVLSAGSKINNLTVQHSIVCEGLRKTNLFHGEYDTSHPGHSMGSLFKPKEGNMRVTVSHNLYAHNGNRNPAIGSYASSQEVRADIRNNVIFNCPSTMYNSGESKLTELNLVGNYLVFGPDSKQSSIFKASSEGKVKIWQQGNFRDLDRNSSHNGRDDGWSSVEGSYSKASGPFSFPAVTARSATEAYTKVLAEAGARPWNRDSHDKRVVQNVKDRKGKIIDSQEQIGGYGSLAGGTRPVDTDGDGMPDDWERTHGTDPNRADHNEDRNGDGYTNLENYLQWAARLSRQA
jgi:hypothetical protein